MVSNSMHASRKIKLQVTVCLGKFVLSLLLWKLMKKSEVGIWECRKLQAGRWALTLGGKQLEGVMEAKNLRRNKSENLDVCSELWREKTVRQTRFIIFYRIFPPPLPQNKIFGGGEGEFSWFLNKHGGRSLPFFRHFLNYFLRPNFV